MDLLTVIAQCSLAKSTALVLVMAHTFSQGNPYTVRAAEHVVDGLVSADDGEGDALDNEVKTPTSRRSAMTELRRLAGASPLVGLLPVPPSWASIYQKKPEDLLDPCINLSIATAQLSEFEETCTGHNVRACALHKYGQAAGIEDFELVVLDMLAEEDASANAKNESDSILSSDLFVAESHPRTWGADRIFMHVDAQPPSDRTPSPKKAAASERAHSSPAIAKPISQP